MTSTPQHAPATQGGPAPAAHPATGPSHREIVTILGGLMIGMFLAALDQTIVATSIRTIGDDLNGLSLQAWVTTAYLMTSTISTPLYGKLSDIYGRKPFYLLAIALFVIGSFLAGTADSMYQLAVYRAVQGLGAGGLMALAITILGDLVAPRESARYQAYFLAVWGTSSVLGPVIGGFFAGAESLLGIAGWRWVFLVNVPIGVAAFAVIWRVLHLPPMRRIEHRIDWPGAVALVVALVPLLLVAEQGRSWGWTSAGALTCYALGAAGIVAFLLTERAYGTDALLPLYLFRERTFSVGAGANLVIGVGLFGGLGTSAMVVGALLFSRLQADTVLPEIFVYSVVFGLGLRFTMQPLVLAVQNAVPMQDMGVATSSSLFFRQVGGTLGTAVFLSILFSTVGDNITAAFGRAVGTAELQAALADPAVQADPANAPVLAMVSGSGQVPSLDDSSFITALDPRLARPFLEGFSESVDLVLLIASAVMVVGVVLTILLPELPLRDLSGIQGRLAQDEAAAGSGGGGAAGDAGAVGSGSGPHSGPRAVGSGSGAGDGGADVPAAAQVSGSGGAHPAGAGVAVEPDGSRPVDNPGGAMERP